MEFFFHSEPKNGVAAISYIFPHRDNTAEYGLIIFPDVTVNPMPNVWDILDKVTSYPTISEIANPLKFYNTTIATIPMGGPVSSLYANSGFASRSSKACWGWHQQTCVHFGQCQDWG